MSDFRIEVPEGRDFWTEFKAAEKDRMSRRRWREVAPGRWEMAFYVDGNEWPCRFAATYTPGGTEWDPWAVWHVECWPSCCQTGQPDRTTDVGSLVQAQAWADSVIDTVWGSA